MTTSTWWRILRPTHSVIRSRATGPGREGSLSKMLSSMPDGDLELLRNPNRNIIEVLDSRRILDTAAAIGVDHRGGLLQLEAIAAAIVHNGELWYGRHANVSPVTARIAGDIGIRLHILSDAAP